MIGTTNGNRRPVFSGRGAVALMAVLSALLIHAGIGAEVASAQADLSVTLSPQLIKAELRPGARTTFKIQLTNTDPARPLRVRAFVKDIKQGARGQYLLSDTLTPYSCVDWLQLEDTLFEIAVGGAYEVNVPVVVPPRASGGGYGAVVFELLPREPERVGTPQASTTFRFQIPAFFELAIKTFGGGRKRLRSGEMIVQTAEDSPDLVDTYGPDKMLVATEIENIGDVLLEVKGQVFIRDADRRLVKLVPLGAGRGAILPGARTFLRSIVKRLNPGEYTIRAVIQYGGYAPAVSQSTFEVGRTGGGRVSGAEITMPLEIAMRPEQIELNAPARSFRSFGVTLINREPFPIGLDVKLGQFYCDLDGTRWTVPFADSGRTLAPWLTFEPTEAVIEPGRQQNIRVNIQVPDSVAGGYYNALLITARSLDSIAEDTVGSIPSELSFPIYLTVAPGLEYSGEIEEIEVEETEGSGVTFKVIVRNTGNIHTLARGSIAVQRWSEDVSAIDSLVVLSKPTFENVGAVDIEPDSTWILPNEHRMLTSESIRGIPPGRYKAIARVSFHPRQPEVVKEKEFVVKPPDEQ
ncbi:MAG TPA: hypothetical protein VM118_12440 [Acidobacteriota bacterium]|nr:hypothetical protein [Acidobacteriota bacterium]